MKDIQDEYVENRKGAANTPTKTIPAIIAELFLTHPAIKENVKRTSVPILAITLKEMQLASTRRPPGKLFSDSVTNDH